MKRKFRRFKRKLNRISKSQKLLFLLASFASILFIVGSTFAWFSSTDARENNFDAKFKYEVNLVDEFTPPTEIKINEVIPKKVTAKNTGDIDAFVRVMIFPVIVSKEGTALSTNESIKITYGNLNLTDWKEGKDGYYYYLKKLKPNEEAPLLFDSVEISNDKSTSYEKAKFTIEAKSESVDARYNAYRESFWQVDREAPQLEEPLKSIDQIWQSEVDK